RWLEGGAELVTVAKDAVGDRDRVGRIALARTLVRSLALDPPRWHVEDLVACGGGHGADEATVAGGGLGTDQRLVRTAPAEPAAKASDAVAAVRDRERRDRSAALVDERRGVASLVDVNADDHASSLPVEDRDRLGLGAGRDCVGGLANAPIKSPAPSPPR